MERAVETQRKLTAEDYELLPDDGQRHEIVDGKHVVTPAPGLRHQRVVRRLAWALEEAVAAGAGGEVFFAPLDVRLSPHDVVEPDVRNEKIHRLNRRAGFQDHGVVELATKRALLALCTRRQYCDALQREDGSWLVDGAMDIEDVKARLGLGPLPGEGEGDFETLGGFALHRLAHIPVVGERFEWDGWRLEIVDMDRHRVDKVLLTRVPAPPPTGAPRRR